jgi:enediyne biosynthesis protein E4
MSGLTRRQLVQGLGAVAAGHVLRPVPIWGRLASTAAKPLFEEMPPGASGIAWRHVNGRSPEYYLPETTGAGCAFLDYDNDGWVDIYLVNSGKIAVGIPVARYPPHRPVRALASAYGSYRR